MLKIELTGQKLKSVEYDFSYKPEIATDSINQVEFEFLRGEDWKNLDLTAQFTSGETTYSVHLDENGRCYLPAGIPVGELYVSVFGVGADGTRGTTFPLKLTVKKSGFVGDGETPIPPTPDLYAQLMDEMKKAGKTPVDPTFSNEGEAADAKKTGEYFEKARKHFGAAVSVDESANMIDPSKWIANSILKGYGNSVNDPQPFEGVSCQVIENVKAGTYVSNIPYSGNACYSVANATTGVISSTRRVSELGESGMYEITVATDCIVALNADSTLARVPFAYFAPADGFRPEDVKPYGDNYTLGKKLKGTVSEDYLTPDIAHKLETLYMKKAEPVETYSGKVIAYNGVLATLNPWSVALIKLSFGETLVVYGDTVTGDKSHLAMCEMFSNGTPQKVLYKAGDYRETPMVHTATKETEYIWVMFRTVDRLNAEVGIDLEELKNSSLNIGENAFDMLLRYRYRKAICIGDSLTFGRQPGLESRDSYPSYLARMTGMEVTNAGESGATTTSWWTKWNAKYNFGDYEAAFICLGTNGSLTTSGTEYEDYKKIIDKIKSDNPKCAIFLMDALKSNAIKAVEALSAEYDVPFMRVIDNSVYSLRALSPQDPITPIHDMEGDTTHLSPWGYLIMARNVVSEMCRDFVLNPHRYLQRYGE